MLGALLLETPPGRRDIKATAVPIYARPSCRSDPLSALASCHHQSQKRLLQISSRTTPAKSSLRLTQPSIGELCARLTYTFSPSSPSCTRFRSSTASTYRMLLLLCVPSPTILTTVINRNAYVAGMARDLQLQVGSRYSLATLIFFVPYVPFP